MHIDLTPEAMLAQLGYSQNEHTLAQINSIIANTKNFDHFSKHLLSLQDALAVEKGYIAMSNSENYLKIKCDEDSSADNLSAFNDIVHHWSDKYRISLKQVDHKPTYYILGQN
ncbi:MAG: hypothetical protein IE885_07945 [Campylobacterales bacterium]|nr:hypothetical protein [Campylobacterales bacterium]